jgi:hypothetical protein
MILTWRIRKKLIISSLFFLFIGIIAFFVVNHFLPEPTCFDNKKNQKEEAVDCGGPCEQCVVNPKDIVALWSRVFPAGGESASGGKIYEVAALIENPNLFYGLPLFKYIFKVYDSNNVLVAIKEGQSFLNPRDKFLIFASDINTGKRDAVRAFIEIEYLSNWKYIDKEKPSLVVSGKSFMNMPFPTLRARLYNESLFSMENIQAAAVLYNDEGNAIAVSSTKLDFIPKEESREIIFTWPAPFAVEPSSSEIFTRIYLFR